MILKLSVLAAAILQVVAPAFLSIGTFEEGARLYPIYIQPIGWTFSVWGLIYVLSLVYAGYQLLPKNDNALLEKTRVPALLGFLSSVVWLIFAGMDSWLVWFTLPALVLIAFFFTVVIRASAVVSPVEKFFSQVILYPYAAWTGIAFWINVQAAPLQEGFITSNTEALAVSAVLLLGILLFSSYYFYKTNYSLWYGGVLVWASAGVVAANMTEYDNLYFATIAALYGVTIGAILIWRLIQFRSIIT